MDFAGGRFEAVPAMTGSGSTVRPALRRSVSIDVLVLAGGAGLVVGVLVWVLGLDGPHSLVWGVCGAGAVGLAHWARHSLKDVADARVEDAPGGGHATGTRADLVQLAGRLGSDVEGRRATVSAEGLRRARTAAAIRARSVGLTLTEETPESHQGLGASAYRVLIAEMPGRVRTAELIAALDRLEMICELSRSTPHTAPRMDK